MFNKIDLLKMIGIRFLKVQNEWLVFKNDCFFENETKNDRLTIVSDCLQKRLTTLGRSPSKVTDIWGPYKYIIKENMLFFTLRCVWKVFRHHP